MFTVKHIDKSGNEALFACASFVKERRSDGFSQYLALPEGPDARDNYVATWCGDDGTGPNLTGELMRHAIYVMNRDGATVAVHRFDDARFGTVASEVTG